LHPNPNAPEQRQRRWLRKRYEGLRRVGIVEEQLDRLLLTKQASNPRLSAGLMIFDASLVQLR
jgi:hypothetical protein